MPAGEFGAVADQVLDETGRGVDDPADADKTAGAADDLAADDFTVTAAEDVQHAAMGE